MCPGFRAVSLLGCGRVGGGAGGDADCSCQRTLTEAETRGRPPSSPPAAGPAKRSWWPTYDLFMTDLAIDGYLGGDRLYGDDFSSDEIARWYAEEAEAYTDLVDGSVLDEFEYGQWSQRFGFRHLGASGNLGHVVGFGSGFGHELEPLDARAERFTIIESSSTYQREGCRLRTPVEFVRSEPSGRVSLADASADLIVCFGVLHHIPNVSFVISEFRRVLKDEGYLVLREPIVSMGDWRQPRPGLTKNERGIPLPLLVSMLEQSGFLIERSALLGFPVVPRLASSVRVRDPYNRTVWTLTDQILCRLFARNYSYHSTGFFGRLRPTSVSLVNQARLPCDR